MPSPQESRLIIVGAARNVQRTLARQVEVFEKAFESFRSLSFFIVESDSSDKTLEVLSKLKFAKTDFNFVSLGNLAPHIPLRTHRLVCARNTALDQCLKSPDLASADYVAVADWDGVNLELSARAVHSCWDCGEWDVVTANQPEGYYDVWALRHKLWCPHDCWDDYRRIEKELGSNLAQQIAIASKRIRIPESHGAIEVESAFGGLAIYKSEFFFKSRYQSSQSTEQEICEHVPFNTSLRALGARIVINPRLVNTYSHHDSLPPFSVARLKHSVRRLIRMDT